MTIGYVTYKSTRGKHAGAKSRPHTIAGRGFKICTLTLAWCFINVPIHTSSTITIHSLVHSECTCNTVVYCGIYYFIYIKANSQSKHRITHLPITRLPCLCNLLAQILLFRKNNNNSLISGWHYFYVY